MTMDRTRAAAWASGAATVVAGIILLYGQRAYFESAGLAMILFGSLVLPFGISMALAMPGAPLARAALAVASAISAFSAATAIRFYADAGALDLFDPAWDRWLLIAISLVLFPAALVWAARPRAWQTATLRALMGTLAIVSLAPITEVASTSWDASLLHDLVHVTYWILVAVPPAALAIGLRPVDEDDAPTNL